jgi:hypothetical protein
MGVKNYFVMKLWYNSEFELSCIISNGKLVKIFKYNRNIEGIE